jgi:UDP-N-acetylmuramoyl-L-alanyl-D-glutamate--2,6-diaminopimelate ligase
MKKLIKKLKTFKWRVKSKIAVFKYGNPSAKLKIIGITGTNGKTTTATLLYKIATELGYKAGLVSTVENIIVNEKKPATHTTPDSISLTKLFSEMAEKGCEYVFMEVSSHGIDQKRIAGINFIGGVFTNLTQDHLDYHKSMENYFLTKKKFFQNLSKDAFALSNADDEHGEEILKDIKAKKYFYGINKQADFKAEIKKLDFDGIELNINSNLIKSKLLGKFNAYNLLTVFSVSKLLGFDLEKVKKILETIEAPKGRFDHFVSKSGILGIVDFAHSPDSLEKVLKTIREFKKENNKIISVFGCGGDRDPLKRRIMGKIGVENSDFAILTSDNPRSEDPEKIIAEMKTDLSMNELKKVKVITDRSLAIGEAVKLAQKGDIVLCAGKGHESYQEIKGVKQHFNDMEELRKNLV